MCTVGLQEILKATYRFVELRAVSSYLIAVVAIMKRCRDRLLQLSSTAFVSSNFYLSTCERYFFAGREICCLRCLLCSFCLKHIVCSAKL